MVLRKSQIYVKVCPWNEATPLITTLCLVVGKAVNFEQVTRYWNTVIIDKTVIHSIVICTSCCLAVKSENAAKNLKCLSPVSNSGLGLTFWNFCDHGQCLWWVWPKALFALAFQQLNILIFLSTLCRYHILICWKLCHQKLDTNS